PMFKPTFARALFAVFALFTLITFLVIDNSVDAQRIGSLRSESQPLMMTGTITGRVFRDFNSNGVYETSGGTTAAPRAIDTGVANVTVSAYDTAGTIAGTAVTAANGTYSLAASGTGPYRIEFT